MLDDLEALLKTAKHEAYQRTKKASAARVSAKTPPLRQADMEWLPGETVCLIHRAFDGTETALGMFTAHYRGTSRWLRPTAETISVGKTEIVTGTWWLNPNIREVTMEDSPHEVAAIRDRFEMLLREACTDIDTTRSTFGLSPIFAERRVEEDEDFDEDDDWEGEEDDWDDEDQED